MTVIDDEVQTVLADAWMRDSNRHGEEHWRCVAATGLSLADDSPGCDRTLVFLFGLLHDIRRENEHVDPGHGPRGALYARELARAGKLTVETARLEILCQAIELHSNGLVSADPTIALCWDADRLHLPRVGITPDPERFSTSLARAPQRLADAAHLRATPPSWTELLRLV